MSVDPVRLARAMVDKLKSVIVPIETRLVELEQRAPIAGPQGEKGLDGTNGRDGIDGKDGIAGVNGKDGAPGQQGEMGLSGKDGAPGERGEKGDAGADGMPGEAGPIGEKGDRGDVGQIGPQGEKGFNGIDGKDGAPGKDAVLDPALAQRLMDVETRLADVTASRADDLAPDDLAAAFTELLRKDLADVDLMPRTQKRVVRDAHGKIERVVEEVV